MIAQVLDRSFVLPKLSQVLEVLKNPVGDGNIVLPEAAERADLAAFIEKAMANEAADLKARRKRKPSSNRRGGEMPIENGSYFSHDPVVSLTQTALEQCFEERHLEELIVMPVPVAPRGRRLSGPQIPVANVYLSDEFTQPGTTRGRRVGEAFSQTDARWVACSVAEGIQKFRRPHKFPADPAPPVQLPERCRLVLVGDWGSGLHRARKVADEISKVLAEGKTAGLEQHVVHLGDVYYSGWDKEQWSRFLDPWPVAEADKDRIGSWSLNGNHDMFSGGYGYFDTLLADPRFARQAGSSRFSFEHPHWRILGLDTAYKEHDLAEGQEKWVEAELLTARQAGKKGFLLSHHQLFSAYEDGGPLLRQKLGEVMRQELIHTWFWGHEHRCALYEPFDGIQFARCVGHGGVPVYMTHETPEYLPPCIWEYRGTIDHGNFERMLGLKWAKFGFAVLDFDREKIEVRYLDEDGIESKRETIQ